MTKLSELSLHHVDPGRLLFARIGEVDDVPLWYAEASPGGMKLENWVKGSVLVTMETKAQRDHYVAVVSVVGMFATDGQLSLGPSEEDSIIENSSREEIDAFATNAVKDLYPFLRSELFMLTSRFSGAPGIMLQPQPVLGTPRSV